jgi:hypothetical protein
MRRLVLVALLLLSALPAWAVDDANRQEKEALQTAKRRMIEACTDTHVNAAQCDALVNFYRALREDEH